MFIVDFGSGNSCRNNLGYAINMVNQFCLVDPGEIPNVVIKWQLFKEAGQNIPLDREVFREIYKYAFAVGYPTTASVFDLESLEFLLGFDIPFVKIANRRDLNYLIPKIPKSIPIIKSVGNVIDFLNAEQWKRIYAQYFSQPDFISYMCCVSEYPAQTQQYEKTFSVDLLRRGISDHTCDWTLYEKYKPEIYECHFVIEHNDENPDGRAFARIPSQLLQIKTWGLKSGETNPKDLEQVP